MLVTTRPVGSRTVQGRGCSDALPSVLELVDLCPGLFPVLGMCDPNMVPQYYRNTFTLSAVSGVNVRETAAFISLNLLFCC